MGNESDALRSNITSRPTSVLFVMADKHLLSSRCQDVNDLFSFLNEKGLKLAV